VVIEAVRAAGHAQERPMPLDELGLPATVRADLERIAEELGMSDDILIDHIL
jgi:hypothetical protein